MADKAPLDSWSTGLCDCLDDCGNCCLTCWCPCITFGRIAELIDRGTTGCCAHGTLYCVLVGFTHFAGIYGCIYRTKMRRVYGINGNQAVDCLASCFCPHVSLCQEYRELKARGFDPSAGWEKNVEMQTRGVTTFPAMDGGMTR